MVDFYFLKTVQWTVFISIIQCQDSFRKVDLLRERIQRLETRLTEDITMLREEFYIELESVSKLSSTGDNNRDTSVSSVDLTEDFQVFQDSILKKIRQFQLGLSDEKRIRRSIQYDLHFLKDKEECKTTVMDEILEEVKTFRTVFAENRASGHVNMSQALADNINLLVNRLSVKDETKIITELLQQVKDKLPDGKLSDKHEHYQDCSDLRRHGFVTNGVYTVFPETLWRPLKVYCDMETNGGGWTVFQRRKDGSENFNRQWMDYTYGFGNLEGEFWLGNEFLHRLTKLAPQELRIELEDFDNDLRVAEYGEFAVETASEFFSLTVGFFSGNVTDSLISTHNGKGFSTSDRGPSTTCSNNYKGGWWYGNCHRVNINGLYHRGEHKSYADGVNWFDWRGHHYSLKFTEMKFRSK